MTDQRVEQHGGLLQYVQDQAKPAAATTNNGPLYAALAKAQAAFKPVLRTKTVRVQSSKGNYTFDYAPLEAVLEATREALAENELALFQLLGHVEGELCLQTTLGHSSGCKVFSSMSIPQTTTGYDKDGTRFERPKTAQEIGSAVTYMRRYMAQCVLGVNAEEDDDGAQGEDMHRDTKPREQARTAPTPPKVERPKPVQQSAPPKQASAEAARQEPGDQAARQAGPVSDRPAALTAEQEQALTQLPLERPPSVPPPNGDVKPSKESMNKMRSLIQELGMTKMVPEWCTKILGVLPAQITLEAQIQTLIADLEQRKAAT